MPEVLVELVQVAMIEVRAGSAIWGPRKGLKGTVRLGIMALSGLLYFSVRLL